MKFDATNEWYKKAAESESNIPTISAGYMPINQWISVKDEVPECGKRILVYRKNYAGDSDLKTMVGYINHKEQFMGVLGELIDDDLYPHTLVTHWMHLPEPPIENK